MKKVILLRFHLDKTILLVVEWVLMKFIHVLYQFFGGLSFSVKCHKRQEGGSLIFNFVRVNAFVNGNYKDIFQTYEVVWRDINELNTEIEFFCYFNSSAKILN